MRGYRGDFSVADSNVANRIDLVLGVDHMAALEQQVVLLGESGGRGQ